ncbi:monocarboxylate transporter 9-like isoform X2 [Octopus sinensis]|nr:monocarboxylate transporter 9-like isoform X2 [Octopus sinensis]XP_036366547.1 monocarboxylate transporter 9-like isoform X2 [Octopus sinensis]XP_036366548.1 monocarboxylate transporter 9-like isoform X2 [Octopus sinensis]
MVSQSTKSETSVKDVERYQKQATARDGGWGWVVCFAAASICFIVVCLSNSVGILLIGLRRVFDDPVSKLSLIGALLVGLSMLAAPVASILLNYFNHRTVLIFAGLLGFTGAVLGAFSTNIDMLIVTYGFMSGVSLGISYFTCQIITGLYFDKKRATAIGITNCGGGLGTMTAGIFVDYLLDFYGLRGTLLIISGLLLNVIVFGALCRPLKNPFKDGAKAEYTHGTSPHSARNAVEKKLPKETNGEIIDNENTKSLLAAEENGMKNESIPEKQKIDGSLILKRCFEIIGVELFKNANFMLLVTCYVLFAYTVIMTTYIPPMCVWSFGMSQRKSAILVTLHGLFAIVGELSFGVFMDLLHFTSAKIFIFALLLLSSSAFLMPHCDQFEYIAPLVCMVGLSIGLIVSLRLILTTEIASKEHATKAYSILSFISGISYFTSSPLIGSIFDTTKSFLIVFYGGGVCALIAIILFLFITYRDRCCKKCLQKKSTGINSSP